MLFIDTLLLSPIYGAIWAARQVHNAIKQEQAAEPAQITAELSDLYMMLETHRITEAEFDAREKVLLDRLDRLQEGNNNQPEEAKTVSEGRAQTVHPTSPVGSKARETDGARPATSRKNGIVKAAAMAILPIWFCLPLAGAAGDSNSTGCPDRLSEQRLAALAMVETGCGAELACREDRLVGRAGEVSRYQILPSVWRQHHRLAAGGSRNATLSFRDPALAKAVAQRVMGPRTAVFVRATGRAPNDFEWYLLWHKPGAFARAGHVAHRLSPVVKERAQRFSNLVRSEERLVCAKGP